MADDKTLAPPYVSFRTFKNRVQSLAPGGTLPQTIDTSLFKTDSGGTQAQLMSALRFLGLVDASGKPSERLGELATGDANQWEKTLADVIRDSYTHHQREQLETGSPKSLRDSMGVYDLQGSVLDKVIRFFVAAAHDAGLKVGPQHGAKASSSSSGGSGGTQRRRRRGASKPGGGPSNDEVLPKGTKAFPLHFAGKQEGRIIIPEDLSDADLLMLDAMVAAVKAYVTQRDEGGSG